jgi:hypothetical protein
LSTNIRNPSFFNPALLLAAHASYQTTPKAKSTCF